MNAFFQEIFNRLSQVFSPDVIGEKVAVIFLNLIVGTLTFMSFYVVWCILNRIFRVLVNKTKMDQTTASFLEKTLKYFFITIGAIEALSSAGIDTGALLASLGIAGLTIGFAARDALSNLISGLLIFWDRPFVIGDLIQVEDYYGRVADITLRSTRVVTVDGKMLAIPNSDIINSTVASYTNFPHLRLDINVTIATTEDIDQARIVLLDIVNTDPDILETPESKVMKPYSQTL